MRVAVEVLPPLPPSACASCRPLEAEVRRLQGALKEAEATARRLDIELVEQKAANAKLKTLLEEARRAGKRQARPFSKGGAKPDPKRSGRKSGDQHGKHGHRDVPSRV